MLVSRYTKLIKDFSSKREMITAYVTAKIVDNHVDFS